MRRFDSAALYRAIEEKRSNEGLSRGQAAAAIGVSASTITRLQAGGRLEVDGMLNMVGWLDVPVETFVRNVSA